MNIDISQKLEELRFLKNDTIDLDRQRDLIKEEVKKTNKNISDLNVTNKINKKKIFFNIFILFL
jgi:hypothetical protein